MQGLTDGISVLPTVEGSLLPEAEIAPVSGDQKRKNAGRLLLAGGVLGLGFDTLCGDRLTGVGFPLFIAALLTGLFLTGWCEGIWFHRRNVALLGLPLLFFSIMVAVHANAFLTFWNVLGTFVLLSLLLHYSVFGSVPTLGFGSFLGIPWKVLGNSLVRPGPLVREVSIANTGNVETRKRLLPLLRGALLALPVLTVFVALLASADELFGKMLGQVATWLTPDDLNDLIRHLMVVAGATWMVAGGFAYAIARADADDSVKNTGDVSDRTPFRLGFTESMMVMGSVTLLFAIFVAVESSYFFGGIEYARSLGLNYATYARRGFWELVSVAVLTLTLVHGLRSIGRRDGENQQWVFNGVGTLLVGLTLVLLGSAMQRMHAYEAAWGATPLRLYVDGFIFWLGVALCWFVATLWRWHAHFSAGVIACGLGYLITLNLVNPDESVAERNVAQFQKTGGLCMETVYKLSNDGVPTLCAAYQKMSEGQVKYQLGTFLRERQDALSDSPRLGASFHFAEDRARRALAALGNQLPVANAAPAMPDAGR